MPSLRLTLPGLRTRRSVWAVVALILVASLAFLLLGRARDNSMSQVEDSGVWRVGLDPSFPPFENLDPATGEPVGFDVDLAHAIADRWGVQAQIVPMGFDQLIDAVAARRVDSAISAMPVVDYRTREVAFSQAYIEAGLLLAVPPASPITGTASLAGRRLATEWGSAGDAAARALKREMQKGPELVLKESPDAALSAVASGEADAVLVDAISLALYRRDGGGLVAVGPPVQSEPYVVVVPARSRQLLAKVNGALDALEADGTLQRLKRLWFGSEMR